MDITAVFVALEVEESMQTMNNISMIAGLASGQLLKRILVMTMPTAIATGCCFKTILDRTKPSPIFNDCMSTPTKRQILEN